MKAAIVEAPGKLVLKDVPDLPPPGPYECLCRNLYAATCTGTDRKIIHGKLPWGSAYPAVLGHEVVGEVTRVGERVRGFREGDCVLRPVYVYPGRERGGLHAEFGGFSEEGFITDVGAMREDGVPEEDIPAYAQYQMKLPASLGRRPESVILITMKETYSWIRRLEPLYGQRVAVIGAGAVGMFYMKFASLLGAREVVAVARTRKGAARAARSGADSFVALAEDEPPAEPFDVVIDAAGLIDRMDEFLPWVKRGGTFAVYGVGPSMSATVAGFGSGLTFSFHNSAESDATVHEVCVSLVEKGFINLREFHSSIMGFPEVVGAFDRIERGEEFKPLLRFDIPF